MDHFRLTDEQFVKIAPLLPNDTRGKERVGDRRVISGIESTSGVTEVSAKSIDLTTTTS